MKNLYESKKNNYYSQERKDIIQLIDQKDLTILEIGAAQCDTLVYLKEQGIAKEIHAVELMEIPNSNQQNKMLNSIFIGKIEDWNCDHLHGKFDRIILADVLEHLYDPWSILNKLYCLLNSNGKIIVSIPNIRYLDSFINIILKGSFPYENDGLFDKTHIRFFCKKNMIELFKSTGYHIEKSYPSVHFLNSMDKPKLLNNLSFGLFEEFFSLQYYFILKK
jgi:2-polyprenyl-3-methyl-5-hydroxy-6-metoxy-1,4-benzoquinol methylase